MLAEIICLWLKKYAFNVSPLYSFIISILLTTTTSGCGLAKAIINSNAITNISIGDSKERVLLIMGTPSEEFSINNEELLLYKTNISTTKSGTFTTIRIIDGKVTKLGHGLGFSNLENTQKQDGQQLSNNSPPLSVNFESEGKLKQNPAKAETSLINTTPSKSDDSSDQDTEHTEVALIKSAGVYEIPVEVNEVLKINFILDSGASDVSISADVALTLIRTDTITKEDWLPGKTYQFADGSKAKSQRFTIRSIKIGNRILRNIACSISNSLNAPMLLGQSALEQLGRFTIDYKRGILSLD